jgi:elongation factor Ts
MSITAQQVNELRQRTGVSMMECKKALTEANGDEEKAIEVLRKRGAAKAVEKADRVTKQGVVITKVQGNKAAVVKLLCETDFVAKNEEFRAIANNAVDIALKKGAEAAKESQEQPIKDLFTKLGENMAIEVKVMEGEGIADYIHSNNKLGVLVRLKDEDNDKARNVAMQIAAMNPTVINPGDVADADVAKEKEIWKAQLATEGKPEQIWDKIMIGKEKKYREESALMKQSFVKNGEMTIEQYLEGNTVVEFMRVAI